MTNCWTRRWTWRPIWPLYLSRQAIRFTKRALNQWLLNAGPIFDHSLALEMLGFFSADMMAGVDGLRRKEKGAVSIQRMKHFSPSAFQLLAAGR